MKPEDFILEIIQLYQDARVPKYNDKKIRRGRSRSISSTTEDLFAHYLLSNDHSIDCILVDQHMKVSNQKKAFYPDISIIRNGVITAFFDLKMDLGWMRNGLFEICKKDSLLLKKIQGKQLTNKVGEIEGINTLTISKNAIYDIVIISNKNINQFKIDEHIKKIKESKFKKNVEVHILTSNEHPNAYGVSPKELLKMITIDKDTFRDIKKRSE